MASRAKKTAPGAFDLLPLLPPEGPELDVLIKAKVAEADADPRPYVPSRRRSSESEQILPGMAENTGHPVILSEAAIADMSELGCWIEQRADADTAQAYVARIEATRFRLATFPNRGTPRFDISAWLA